MATFDADGAALYYTETGTGLPTIVLHGGFGLDHTYLHPSMDRLGRSMRLVYLDLRGNGRSARVPLEALDLDRLVRDVDALRAYLGLDRVAVMGHSYGGVVAQAYALAHPDRVSHLLLMGTFPASDFWDEAMTNLEARHPKLAGAFATPAAPSDAGFKRWLSDALPAYFHAYEPRFGEAFWARTIVSFATWARGNAFIREFDSTGALDRIAAPTLVLHGRSDLVPVSQGERLHKGIPGSDLVVLERCGHFPWLEVPDAFSAAVEAWVARKAAAGR